MKRIRLLAYVLLVMVIPSTMLAQERPVFSKRVLIFRSGADAMNGHIISIDDSALVILTPKKEERIQVSDITRIIVPGEHRPGQGAAYGMLIGSYASSYMFASGGRGNDEPFVTGELNSPFGVFIMAGSGMLLGGTIGYLIDSGGETEDELIDLTNSANERLHGVERLRAIVEGHSILRKFHFSVGLGYVSSDVTNQYSSEFKGQSEFYEDQRANNFNILRRIVMTYSITPNIDVGVAMVWLGEPGRTRYQYETVGNDSRSTSLNQSFHGKGRYAFASYKLPLGQKVEIGGGGGLGVASVDYSLSGYLSTYSSTANPSSATQYFMTGISDNFASAYITADLVLRLYDGLSLGLTMDHFFVDPQQAPGIPGLGIPAKTVKFGNTSVDASLGLHF